MMFNEEKKIWKNVSPWKGDAPAPWFGFVQICFYNYIFIFGGQGEGGKIFGDLWVYDIIKEDWHEVSNTEKTHQLTHENVKGIIPQARVQATGVLFDNLGAAVILGGLSNSHQLACDVWTLDLDMIIDWIEQPNRFKKSNFWTWKEIELHQEYLCRYAHSSA